MISYLDGIIICLANTSVAQYYQMAEIPAKKLKKGPGEKVGQKNSWPNFCKILPKVAEKINSSKHEKLIKILNFPLKINESPLTLIIKTLMVH
jgi:hypothetical protein